MKHGFRCQVSGVRGVLGVLSVCSVVMLSGCQTFPVPVPEPAGDPDEAAHGLDLSKAIWQGHWQGPNAKLTVKASNLTLNYDWITMSWTRHSWQSSDGSCDGTICAAWKVDGIWYAAYLDYCPMNRDGYGWNCLKNMADSDYEPKPLHDSESGFFILSENLQERSNVLFGEWPL